MSRGIITITLLGLLLLICWMSGIGRLSYGHGFNDAVYYLITLSITGLLLIIAIILYFTKSSFLVLNWVLLVFLCITILQHTLLRGPVHPWNGKIPF